MFNDKYYIYYSNGRDYNLKRQKDESKDLYISETILSSLPERAICF
jgi:hypothetical protein